MDLTEGQRAALKKADAEVESETEGITRMACQAFAERKAFETDLCQSDLPAGCGTRRTWHELLSRERS